MGSQLNLGVSWDRGGLGRKARCSLGTRLRSSLGTRSVACSSAPAWYEAPRLARHVGARRISVRVQLTIVAPDERVGATDVAPFAITTEHQGEPPYGLAGELWR